MISIFGMSISQYVGSVGIRFFGLSIQSKRRFKSGWYQTRFTIKNERKRQRIDKKRNNQIICGENPPTWPILIYWHQLICRYCLYKLEFNSTA